MSKMTSKMIRFRDGEMVRVIDVPLSRLDRLLEAKYGTRRSPGRGLTMDENVELQALLLASGLGPHVSK